MATIRCFEDLNCWQKARTLDNNIYQLTLKHSIARDFRLIDQWRGASGSIMDNIAEGFERDGNKEFINFLSIAKGSAGEVRSQTYRALDRNYISQEEFNGIYAQCIEISNLLQRFMAYLRQSDMKGNKFKVGEPEADYYTNHQE
ncbi:four helix bundle protein [Spirosoma litoris]